MKKKHHRVFAGILVVLISVAMVGSGFAMFFSSSTLPSGNNPATSTANAAADYQAQKARIDAIAAQAKKDASNIPLQEELGNEYYNAGVEAQTAAPAEVQENFKHAVEAYQIVLKTNKDPNVMVNMATAAFRSGDNTLAETTFKEALALKPDFYNGLINYGVFLADVKQDLPGAIAQWQKAESVASSSSEKEQVQGFISQAQSMLKASNNGVSNSNPAINNGTTKPASPGK